jgi:hypothetical protein
VFGLSIIKHITLQKIVAHDIRYDPGNNNNNNGRNGEAWAGNGSHAEEKG